ncbi:outer membrane beta-barrel protein [Bradyrhizobium sp. OK095]|jgi:opacity protein-like surface antigen|uniref:outer membrane protein n=1 Tax=Bradyrhizobium sp. OK095 TaxID=1882760 RepID=UPI0008B82DA2|nr:outer membrane beta-barrel protein [Bradyrhizobium sp. OK095]SEM52890.1 Opacity protein [Bradyrhizobium sp. OK095]
MFRYIAAFLSIGLLLFTSEAKAAIPEDLAACSRLKNGTERLACFDAAVGMEKHGSTSRPPPIAKAIDTAASPRRARKWDGAFVGIGAAAASIKSNSNGSLTSDPGGDPNVIVGGETVSSLSNSAKGSGAGVDLRAGYMTQISSLLLGVQGDLLFPAVKADQKLFVGRCDHPACVSSFNFSGQGSLTANWIASATVKAGWLTPDSANLLYVLGGFSYGDFTSHVVSGISINSFGIGGTYQFSFPRVDFAAAGWTAGLGWERRIDDAWRLYAEYRFSRFGNFDQRYAFSYAPCPLGLACTTMTQMSGSIDLQTVRVGVSRSFAITQ